MLTTIATPLLSNQLELNIASPKRILMKTAKSNVTR